MSNAGDVSSLSLSLPFDENFIFCHVVAEKSPQLCKLVVARTVENRENATVFGNTTVRTEQFIFIKIEKSRSPEFS